MNSNNLEKAGFVVGLLSLLIAIGAFFTPEIRCNLGLEVEACTESKSPNRERSPKAKPTESIQTAKQLTAGLVSSTEVAIVHRPPSNVRKSPNGEFLCSVTQKTHINVYGSADGWYSTDICGAQGVIHQSQITFNSDE